MCATYLVKLTAEEGAHPEKVEHGVTCHVKDPGAAVHHFAHGGKDSLLIIVERTRAIEICIIHRSHVLTYPMWVCYLLQITYRCTLYRDSM